MRIWIAIALIAPLYGCDVPHGYKTETVLPGKPDLECISRAMSKFGSVVYRHQAGGGMEHNGNKILEMHYWTYNKHGPINLEIIKTTVGWEYENGNVHLANPDDVPSLKKDTPTIIQANKFMQQECNLPVGNLLVRET